MTDYRCFRCGYDHEVYGEPNEVMSRRCPSCGEEHACFTFEEMGDILNNIYLEGKDLEAFSESYEL